MRRDLPTGTVTFLFTDIEGSTKLIEDLGEEDYVAALAEHRRALREALAAHDGVEVDTQGDAFLYVFADPGEAVTAAARAQEALAPGPVKVRMGLHTGESRLTGEGYAGRELHRAARIAACGHGGQVLVSAATAAVADGELVELGEHRLKDFVEPVAIFQLGGGRFPPLKTISNTNLPRPASSFVGREREVHEVAARLQDGVRLLTLTGAGGSGKTRLAIEAASELVPEFKAGVFWVGLAPLREPALVTDTIAQTLGAKNGLAEDIGERELLLLLDNLEQVVEAAPELAALVEACPNLRLLVTSRELLRVRGEVEYAVPPLAEQEAIELFRRRSGLDDGGEIAELCRRLDNLPLAVELAAARTSVLTPAQILERLSQRLDLLKGGRDAEARQRTLRAAIEWSHELLGENDQRLFARLAVFRGGCTLEAAEQVAEADLDTLQSLVDKSLLRQTNGRFWMLETIREFALERLEASGEAEELFGRLVRACLALARDAQPGLVGRGQKEWVPRIEAERDNIRAALEWGLGSGDAETALELATVLERFWWLRGPAEGLSWLQRGLESAKATVPLRAAALDAAGGAAWFVGDGQTTLRLTEQALSLYRQIGDRAGIAHALTQLAPPLIGLGRVDEAERVVEEGLAISRELGPRWELVLSINMLANVAYARGDFARAQELYQESTELARQIGDLWSLVWNLHNQADLALVQEEAAQAESLARESLAVAHEIGDDQAVVICLGILAAAASKAGDARRAGTLWGAAHRLSRDLGENLWNKGDDYERLHKMLGERTPEFEQGVADGDRLSLDEVLSLVAEGA